MSVQIAFFIGDKKNILDRLIRWRTQSEVSHVELVVNGYKYSSYPGIGVRRDIFVNNPGDWLIYDLPDVKEETVIDFFEKTKGKKYDWLGVLIGQAFYVKVDDPKKFFCSEWCAAVLGFPQACRFSPALLQIVIENTKLNIK
jgi:hypothetical protein